MPIFKFINLSTTLMKNEKKSGLDLNDGCVSTIGAILLWLLIPTIVASAIIAIIKAIVS